MPVQAGLYYEIKLIMSTDLFITCTSEQTHHFKNMLGRTSALLSAFHCALLSLLALLSAVSKAAWPVSINGQLFSQTEQLEFKWTLYYVFVDDVTLHLVT